MIIETYALWGEEPVPDYPATFTSYLADANPKAPGALRPAVIICGGGSFTHIARHEQGPWRWSFSPMGTRRSCSIT